MSHAHVHVPHELTEREGHGTDGAAPTPFERWLELAAVVLLSLTTLATAWSGYQAARWSGDQSQSYARASATRVKAQQQATENGQLRIADLTSFNQWLNADRSGDHALAQLYVRRFRPEFVPAFEAWLAQDPFTNADAVPGPQLMPQYRLATARRAAAYNREADALYQEGTDAKANDDKYVLSTVFFAAVLFFAGISLRLDWRPLRIAVMALATAMLVGGAVFVATLPVA
jgi:hypothetical protein